LQIFDFRLMIENRLLGGFSFVGDDFLLLWKSF